MADIFDPVAIAHATHFQRGRGYARLFERVAQFGFTLPVRDHKIGPAEAFHPDPEKGRNIHGALPYIRFAPILALVGVGVNRIGKEEARH